MYHHRVTLGVDVNQGSELYQHVLIPHVERVKKGEGSGTDHGVGSKYSFLLFTDTSFFYCLYKVNTLKMRHHPHILSSHRKVLEH